MKIPDKYYEELLPITDSNIPSNFEGMPFTLFDLRNYIESVFPDVPLSKIEEDHQNRKIIFHLTGEESENIKINISNKLNKIKLLYSIVIKDKAPEVSKNRKFSNNQVFFIPSYNMMKKLKLPFLKRDEELWFDNLDKIYEGTFNKNNLYFFDKNKAGCFIDFSVFDNINLRNHLLLYDTIYCTLPIENKITDFWNKQKLTKIDFISLVEKGRLKIINTQPVSRLDIDLLRDVYEVDPNAIASRRAIAALCAIDLVSMNSKYIFNDVSTQAFIILFATVFSNKFNISLDQVLQYLLWPKFALRQSFNNLHLASTKSISNFGVNNIIPID